MNRRDLIAFVDSAAVAAPLAAQAQQKARVPRIGYLATDLPNSPSREAFLQGLRDLGYVEGGNVVIEYRDGEGKNFEQLPVLAAELAALGVDVIVAGLGTLAALAAKQATTTIPIVFVAVGD